MAGAGAAEGKVIVCHTKDEFDAQLAKANDNEAYNYKLVVIDFMSPTCGPCKLMAPVFAACAKEYPATKVVFLEVDVTELKEVAEEYRIQGEPTFVFIKYGLTLESFIGAYPDKLRKTIDEFIDYTTPASASSSA